jgi:hypothetical protein
MHNSSIMKYSYYIKNLYLDMFRAIICSSSGGQNFISTASGIVTLCERPCSAPVESGLYCSKHVEVEVFNVIRVLHNGGVVHQVGN